MRGEIINTGTEMLLGQIVNTNAAYLCGKIAMLGIDVYHQVSVGDNMDRIVSAIRDAMERSDIIFLTGGLGPTEDDLTREAIAAALDLPLVLDEKAMVKINKFFEERQRKMTDNNRKQAMFPEGSVILVNAFGTADGLLIEKNGKAIVSMPGPPSELKYIFEEKVVPCLMEKYSLGGMISSKVYKLWGIGESQVDFMMQDLFHSYTNPTIAYLFNEGQVIVRVTAKGENEKIARQMLLDFDPVIRERLEEYIFAEDEEEITDVLKREMTAHGLTISLAESCTGGLVSHLITNVPGSSDYLDRSIVSYSNKAKKDLLGVSQEILDEYGAVSKECAEAMLDGILKNSGSDIGLAITGIAGPATGKSEKPVGIVYIAVGNKDEKIVREYRFFGGRERIKNFSARTALHQALKLVQRRYNN